MDDLFDFSGGADAVAPRKRRERESKSKQDSKPRAETGSNGLQDVSMEDGDAGVASSSEEESDDGLNGASASRRPRKKARKFDPAPVVMDEIEIQANRELPVNAGLSASSEAEAGQKLTLTHNVRHQVAIPPGYDYVPISQHVSPAEPARVYPFKLDPFQQVSVYAIERNESVLVSAHTSAGKTVVAEYAIAQALKNKQRVIYTSPIKALSNQKYREMLAEFGDVGLMTGDVTINPTASCLVMTTEILRSMLYRGSEIVREVAWVIFDEIHYMRDKERGVVWEETLILLPHTVRYVFLSATIPNAMQFAEWICKTHEQPCHVVYTDFRPTPLQHYLFPAGGEGIYMVVNEKGEFREENFQKAMGMLTEKMGEDPASAMSGRNKKGKTKKGGTKGPSDIYKIVKMIMLKGYNPVIIFSFSKRDCEALAVQMTKLECNTADESALVDKIFKNALNSLAPEDQKLPQIEHLLPLLRRGIGIHHGGLLPILKEVIEILFQEGLIKVLFATETFSIGLNMPAKTVVFTSVRKFDGRDFRNLSSGEYIQMSGRAGRRGLDARGVVIMMIDEKLEPSAAKGMVKGEADRLDSAFHLGYNMILNLMRVEGVSPEFMLERCFFQFQNQASLPQFEAELLAAEEKKNSIVVPDETNVADYYEIKQQLDELNKDVVDVITHPNYSLPFLNTGRLVYIRHAGLDFGWGVILNYSKKVPANKDKGFAPPAEFDEHPQNQYILDVLLNISAASSSTVTDKKGLSSVPNGIRPCPAGEKGEATIIPVLLSTVEKISQVRLHVPKDLRPLAARETLWKAVLEVQKRFETIPMLDPVANMKISDSLFSDLVWKIKALEERLHSNPIHSDPRCTALYDLYHEKQKVEALVKGINKKISSAHDVLQMDELKCRKRVLRRLGFTTSGDVVDKKGRVACEISTGDELLLTEMIFNNVFNPLAPEVCAGLLSCFVFSEKSEQPTKLREEFQAPLRQLQEIARRIAKVSKENKLAIVEDDYVSSFKVELIDAVVQWCRGMSFADLLKISDQFEGSLIRVFRRLQELLRQMTLAAHAIGDTGLEEKFTKATEMLERPNSVIFCSSLYL